VPLSDFGVALLEVPDILKAQKLVELRKGIEVDAG
jgi:hypothetical protein